MHVRSCLTGALSLHVARAICLQFLTLGRFALRASLQRSMGTSDMWAASFHSPLVLKNCTSAASSACTSIDRRFLQALGYHPRVHAQSLCLFSCVPFGFERTGTDSGITIPAAGARTPAFLQNHHCDRRHRGFHLLDGHMHHIRDGALGDPDLSDRFLCSDGGSRRVNSSSWEVSSGDFLCA